MAFGDFNEEENRIDDLVISDNKVLEKILATVANAVRSFMNENRVAMVFAQGSSYSRTRYYIMGITKHFAEITNSFEIWGALSESEWELFEKNRPYIALMISRK